MLSNLISEFEIFKMVDGDDSCDCTCDECECTCDELEDEYDVNPFTEEEKGCECTCDGLDDTNIDDIASDNECTCDEIDDETEENHTDEDFQGVIRTVKGANMVYKRSQDDGTFEELWLYNIGKDVKHNHSVKRAIIAGTDVEPEQMQSADGSQKMELYSVGNVQFLHIKGLPN